MDKKNRLKINRLDLLTDYHVTDEQLFKQRRKIITGLGLLPIVVNFPTTLLGKGNSETQIPKLAEKVNSFHQITHYNNFYEFSTNKQAVALLAKHMQIQPWTLEVSGEVEKPTIFDLESLSKIQQVERIYRFRCVEGWSMVIPWGGIQLCDLLTQVKPTSRAKYVQFISHVDDKAMLGMSRTGLSFPYREALRMDEAMHPLTLLSTAIYGKQILPQNGAPIRLVVPWKYGFKSSKSIVKIILSENKPTTSWNEISPSEYGFLGNVNPKVSHPRWSQRKENKIGELKKKRTLMFNGYESQVANLYKGMDLKNNY